MRDQQAQYKVPKEFRQARIPKNFEDLDKNIIFVARLTKIILNQNCYVGGSRIKGENWINSDIDIIVQQLPDELQKSQINELKKKLYIKIDI